MASDWGRCKKCNGYGWLDTHRCPPVWEIWRPDIGETRDDAVRAYGNDAEEAAEKWAEDDDAYGDHGIVGGSDADVCAARPDEEFCTFVSVSGEPVPSYRALETRLRHPVQKRTP